LTESITVTVTENVPKAIDESDSTKTDKKLTENITVPKPTENTEVPQTRETPQKEADSPKKEETLPQQEPQSETKDSNIKEYTAKPSNPEISEEKVPEKPVHHHVKKDETQVQQTPAPKTFETPETKVSTPNKQSDDIVKRIDINKADKDPNLSSKIKENDLKSQNDAIKSGKKRDGACTKCIII